MLYERTRAVGVILHVEDSFAPGDFVFLSVLASARTSSFMVLHDSSLLSLSIL